MVATRNDHKHAPSSTRSASDELATPVIVSEAYDPTADMPRPALERFNRAIWDTGATGSVISERVVERLGLYPISQREITTANGSRTRASTSSPSTS